MISKNQIKFVRSLHNAKFRKQEKLFIAEGPKVTEEMLKGRFQVKAIYALKVWIEENTTLLAKHIEVFELTKKELDRISTLVTPNQVLALVFIPEQQAIKPNINEDLTLVLDDIKDPGNMGTIIRTADWFGIKNIICSEKCVEVYNPKVIQSTMGSISRIEIHYTELAGFLSKLPKNSKVYGTVLDGKNMYKAKLQNNSYLVIGSESHGISDGTKKFITDFITIPSASIDPTQAESLNASIATAIVCAEFRRQSK